MTDEEWQSVKERAAKADMSISAYVADLFLKKTTRRNRANQEKVIRRLTAVYCVLADIERVVFENRAALDAALIATAFLQISEKLDQAARELAGSRLSRERKS